MSGFFQDKIVFIGVKIKKRVVGQNAILLIEEESNIGC